MMWRNQIQRFVREEDGPTAVEYAFLLALIIIVCFGAISVVGTNTNAIFNNGTLRSAGS